MNPLVLGQSSSLALAQPMPLTLHPAAVYLRSLSAGSRPTMRQSLDAIAALLTNSECDAMTLNWAALDYQHTAAVQAALLETHSPSTVKKMMSSLRRVLKEATRLKLMNSENYTAAIDLPKIKDTRKLRGRALSQREIGRLMEVCTSDLTLQGIRDAALIAILRGAGLRRAEVVKLELRCGLTWKDVRSSPEGKGMATLYGKGSKTRTVVFSTETWEIVRGLRLGSRPDFPVFLSRKGGHLTPSHVLKIVATAGKRAGIEGKVSPHWLRHSHASHALNRGVPIHLVQATLGHSSIETTGRYLHANPADSSGLHLPV